MIYWLFSQAQLSLCLCPIICGSLCLPYGTAWLLGASIRTSGEERFTSRRSQLARGGVHLLTSLTFVWVYLALLSPFALRPPSDQTPIITSPLLSTLAGGNPLGVNQAMLLMLGAVAGMLVFLLNLFLKEGLRQGGFIREKVDRWRYPTPKRGAMGSSHFCTMREFSRFRRPDPDGMTLYGAFWGDQSVRLDWDQGVFYLSGEDAARGVLTLGGAGSGKTQGVILPVIADRMQAGHSLIVADPQGELQKEILKYAKVTRHLVVIHDPTREDSPHFNLAEGITNVSDARAIADVLVPSAQGDNKFWSDSASALLAACIIRFPTLGAIYSAMNDAQALATELARVPDDAALLANAFIASTKSDGKVAANVIATLGTALTGWAAEQVRTNTSSCDFDASLIVAQPTIVILTCPGRMRAVYAPYLGATLRKLMMDLDTLGEQNGGPLPVPVGVILDEFPTLGKLDSLVADVNLVRKRRISILIGAQTKGQFHMIYGQEGTQALFTGLATQIVYGGCDAETAEFYSKAAGTATVDANADDPSSHLRQRPLLTVDEVIAPARGNCTVFARYVSPGFATQVIFHARLTRAYERVDWQRRIQAHEHETPFLLQPTPLFLDDPEGTTPVLPASTTPITYEASHAVAEVLEEFAPKSSSVKLTSMNDLLGQLRAGGSVQERQNHES